MKESDLYTVLEKHFKKNGFEVKGEVCGCDLVAVKNENLVIIELKKQFNVKLLYQAVRRLAITPLVYVAIFKPQARQKMSYWTMLKSLCRRLQIGLMIIDGDKIKILAEPVPFKHVKSARLQSRILKEFNGRKAGTNLGGTTGIKLETAYLESAIHIAVLLVKLKSSTSKKLIELGTSSKTYNILYSNHYGWFEKEAKGIYSLKKGLKLKISKEYPAIWKYYQDAIS